MIKKKKLDQPLHYFLGDLLSPATSLLMLIRHFNIGVKLRVKLHAAYYKHLISIQQFNLIHTQSVLRSSI